MRELPSAGGRNMLTGSPRKPTCSMTHALLRRRSSNRPFFVATQARSLVLIGSSAGECLQHVDAAVRPQGVIQSHTVADAPAVDEDDDIGAQVLLLVEHIAA
jgi:hypothetical protein